MRGIWSHDCRGLPSNPSCTHCGGEASKKISFRTRDGKIEQNRIDFFNEGTKTHGFTFVLLSEVNENFSSPKPYRVRIPKGLVGSSVIIIIVFVFHFVEATLRVGIIVSKMPIRLSPEVEPLLVFISFQCTYRGWFCNRTKYKLYMHWMFVH